MQPAWLTSTASVIRSRLGVSWRYASKIRQGYRPHPRHWQTLAELVGVVLGVPDRPSAPPSGQIGSAGLEEAIRATRTGRKPAERQLAGCGPAFAAAAWASVRVSISWSSVLSSSSLVCSHFERAHQPRNNHFFEDARIRPYANLPPEMAALRIDPCRLRHITFVE